jgi:hypothetical protein
MRSRSTGITVVSILYFIEAIGIPVRLLQIRYMVENQRAPRIGGIELSTGGFIEDLGLTALILSLALSVVVGAAEILVGYWIWIQRRRALRLAYVLFPIELTLAVGRMAPIPIFLPIVRIVLLYHRRGELAYEQPGQPLPGEDD